MSLQENTEYKESIWDKMQQALEDHDYEKAERIAEAVKRVGFPQFAQELFTVIATNREDYTANQEPEDNTHAAGIEY